MRWCDFARIDNLKAAIDGVGSVRGLYWGCEYQAETKWAWFLLPMFGLTNINTLLSACSSGTSFATLCRCGSMSSYFQIAGTASGLGLGGTIAPILDHKGSRFLDGKPERKVSISLAGFFAATFTWPLVLVCLSPVPDILLILEPIFSQFQFQR